MKKFVAAASLAGGVALLLACQGDEGCLKPLTEFCSDCPELEEVDTQVRTGILDEGYCHHAVRGDCGDLEFITLSQGYGGVTWFFDDAGKLAAVSKFSDYNQFCDGSSFVEHYGFFAGCTRETTEDLCDLIDAATEEQPALTP